MALSLDSATSIPKAFFELAKSNPTSLVYVQGRNPGEALARIWDEATYDTVARRVSRVANFLIRLGFKPGGKAAIIANSRSEWLEADLGILSAAGVSVSVYPSLKPHEIAYILFDSGCEFAFVENQEQLDKVLEIVRNEWDIPATEDRPASKGKVTLKKIVTFEDTDPNELAISFEHVVRDEKDTIPPVVDTIKRDDVATLVYTSGTTGPPKGVVQTHGNHLSNVRQAFEAKMYDADTSIMVFLPLAHAFAKLMGYIAATTLAYAKFPTVFDRRSSKQDPATLTFDIREAGAHLVPVVPRLLEKMQAAVQQQANGTSAKARLLKATIQSAEKVRRGTLSPKERILHLLLGFIRRSVKHRLFGVNLRHAISGGAKLNPEVHAFFHGLGISILEGYGLTETAVATNLNPPGKIKIGTVGPVLAKDIEMKLLDDGEITFRGPNIAKGYYNRPTATASAWSPDGWFKTGDLGSVDADGYLTITGRKKELIVTAGGKKVAPEGIEQQVKALPTVSQAVLVGEGRPFCVALVTLDEAQVRARASTAGVSVTEPLPACPAVKKLVWQDIEKLNKNLASFETIKRVAILPYELTGDNGFLTPTFKIKRNVVCDKFKGEIDALYATAGE